LTVIDVPRETLLV